LAEQVKVWPKHSWKCLGYEIRDEDWAYGKAEIDLVVYKAKVIIFAQVKARTGDGFGKPDDLVENA
jgi:putative endonuclease